jgi:hypothetical protein
MQQEQQEKPTIVTTNEKQRQTKSAKTRRLEKKHQTSAEVIVDKIYF